MSRYNETSTLLEGVDAHIAANKPPFYSSASDWERQCPGQYFETFMAGLKLGSLANAAMIELPEQRQPQSVVELAA